MAGPPPLLLVGGSDPTADVAKFHGAGARVLVGTPGRLNDVMQRSGSMVLKRCELLVLDEADRLLSMARFCPLALAPRLRQKQLEGHYSHTSGAPATLSRDSPSGTLACSRHACLLADSAVTAAGGGLCAGGRASLRR